MVQPRWTPEFLESMRQEMDPLADEVVRRLFEDGGLAQLGRLHGRLLDQDGVPVEGLPDYLTEYLHETADPGDPDPDALRLAEDVLSSHGIVAFTILACASLPECYVDRPGVPVLWETQKLNAHVDRRSFETSQFVIGVMSPGGLERAGAGVRAAQKVRLMHASIRHLMLEKSDRELADDQAPDIARAFLSHDWKHELGMPLNQEDLAYTLQTFGWVTVRSLRKFEAGLTPDHEEAIIHLWNATGRMMGIREDLMPADVAEAEQLFTAIKTRVADAPSAEGQSLSAAILNFAESHIPAPLHGSYGHVPRMLTRFLVGDETADMLAVPALTPDERLQAERIEKTIQRVERRESELLRSSAHHWDMAEWLFRHMAAGMMGMDRGGRRSSFQIPDHLATSWKISEAGHDEPTVGSELSGCLGQVLRLFRPVRPDGS